MQVTFSVSLYETKASLGWNRNRLLGTDILRDSVLLLVQARRYHPGFGYHPLALLLTDGSGSNLVITTNFDSLKQKRRRMR